MKFTSEDLMEWLGLRVGDRIKINDKPDNYIVELNECGIPCVKDEYTKIRFEITYLIDRKIEILPRPKRVGDLKCGQFNTCETCPLQFVCNLYGCSFNEDNSLYNILTKIDVYDQEIYDIFKKRLDKEVEE